MLNDFLLRLYRIDKIKDIIPNAFDNQNINKDYLVNPEKNYCANLNEIDNSNNRDSNINIVQPDKIIYVKKFLI